MWISDSHPLSGDRNQCSNVTEVISGGGFELLGLRSVTCLLERPPNHCPDETSSCVGVQRDAYLRKAHNADFRRRAGPGRLRGVLRGGNHGSQFVLDARQRLGRNRTSDELINRIRQPLLEEGRIRLHSCTLIALLRLVHVQNVLQLTAATPWGTSRPGDRGADDGRGRRSAPRASSRAPGGRGAPCRPQQDATGRNRSGMGRYRQTVG